MRDGAARLTCPRDPQEGPAAQARSFVVSTRMVAAGTISGMNVIADTIAGWIMSARWPAPRRRRYRLGLVLYALGLRRLAVRVAGVPTP
jgi:hypothetical protein